MKMSFFGWFKPRIPSFVGAQVQELVAELGSNAILGQVRSVSELSRRRTQAPTVDQQRLNAALMDAIDLVEPKARRDNLYKWKAQARDGTIPERFGLVSKIHSDDEWMETLTSVTGNFDGTLEELRDSWIPTLTRLAGMTDERFWEYFDGLWPYKFLEQLKAWSLKTGKSVEQIAQMVVGISTAEMANQVEDLATSADANLARHNAGVDVWLARRGMIDPITGKPAIRRRRR